MKKTIAILIFGIISFTGCTQKSTMIIPEKSKNLVNNDKNTFEINEKKVQNKIKDSNLSLENNTMENDLNFENYAYSNKRIALIYGTGSIGKYAIEATNAITSYLSIQKQNYDFQAIDIEIETRRNLNNVIEKLKNLGIRNVIFLITENYINDILENPLTEEMNIFFPIINQDSLTDTSMIKPNMVFGGINYKQQFDAIFNLYNFTENIYQIYDEKKLSQTLQTKLQETYPFVKSIGMYGKNPNYKSILTQNEDLNNTYIILNTSIIKSSIILSQMRALEIVPKKVFSTQLNYSPLIFSLTQEKDRDNLEIINAISPLPEEISYRLSLGQNDIRYNWVNYTSIIGVEYLTQPRTLIYGNQIINNQVIYKKNLMQIDKNRFLNQTTIE